MSSTQQKHPIGRWVRSFGSRYWEGGCTCGSGEEGVELHDGNGIYCGITCKVCDKAAEYRPEIMNRTYDRNDVDEPIDEC